MDGSDIDPWSYLARLGTPQVRRAGDPLFSQGDAICKIRDIVYLIQEDDEEFLHVDYQPFWCEAAGPQGAGCPEPGPFAQLIDYEAHYAAMHRHACSECELEVEKRKSKLAHDDPRLMENVELSLPTEHLLNLHLSEAHDSFFAVMSERKASFQCLLEKCSKLFWTPEERKRHCATDHHFPENFKYLDGWSKWSKSRRKYSTNNNSAANSTCTSPRESLDRDAAMAMVKLNPVCDPPSNNSAVMRNRGSPPTKRNSASSSTTSSPSRRKPRPRSMMVGSSANSAASNSSAGQRATGIPSPVRNFSRLSSGGMSAHSSVSSAASEAVSTNRRMSLGYSSQRIKSQSSRNVSEPCSPAKNRQSLSLAKMGQNSHYLQQISTEYSTAKLSSAMSTDSVRHSTSSSRRVSMNPNLEAGGGARKSKIPVMRSTSVKIPEVISFGDNVARAFVTDRQEWYKSGGGTLVKKKINGIESFESQLREALMDTS